MPGLIDRIAGEERLPGASVGNAWERTCNRAAVAIEAWQTHHAAAEGQPDRRPRTGETWSRNEPTIDAASSSLAIPGALAEAAEP